MQEFTINWSIEGATKVEAHSHREAQRLFELMSKRQLAEDGELLQHGEPETEEDRREGTAYRSESLSRATAAMVAKARAEEEEMRS